MLLHRGCCDLTLRRQLASVAAFCHCTIVVSPDAQLSRSCLWSDQSSWVRCSAVTYANKRNAFAESGIMCQYSDRCPVRHHRPGTKCPYTRHGRSRSASARPRPVRSSLPRVQSIRNIQPEPPKRIAASKRPPRQREEHRRTRRERNRQVLLEGAASAASEAAVTYLFKPNGVYEVVADRMLNSTKLHRRFRRARGH